MPEPDKPYANNTTALPCIKSVLIFVPHDSYTLAWSIKVIASASGGFPVAWRYDITPSTTITATLHIPTTDNSDLRYLPAVRRPPCVCEWESSCTVLGGIDERNFAFFLRVLGESDAEVVVDGERTTPDRDFDAHTHTRRSGSIHPRSSCTTEDTPPQPSEINKSTVEGRKIATEIKLMTNNANRPIEICLWAL